MLRPATPLSILLLVSFVLLLISVISTPIVKGIPLARYQGVNFGVFGWCKDSGKCSSVQIGWNTDQALPPSTDDAEFSLSSSARHSLSTLLIVHPIAAFCNLIVLALAIAAHFHSPSHSARYLLALLILLLPTLLVTLLAFLVDILLFVPHLQWGGWIVLASTILITASGVVTCAMRRTLVSRKARKKRIAENAEMSGANFYARQAEDSQMAATMTPDSKTPMVNGAPGADHLPGFATYNRRSEERPVNEPVPLDAISATSPVDGGRFYSATRSRSSSRPRQEMTPSVGPPQPYDDRPPMPPPAARGAYGAPRGRGTYPPRGAMSARGSFNTRGMPQSPYGRGGYPPRGRGGYSQGPTPPGAPPGAMMPAGMNRRPPPGYGPQNPEALQGGYVPPDGTSGPSTGTPYRAETGFDPTSPMSPSNYGSTPNPAYVPYGSRAQSPARSRVSPYVSRAQSPAGGRIPQEIPPPMPAMPAVPDRPEQSQYEPRQPQPSMVYDAVVQPASDMPRINPQSSRQQQYPPQSYVPPRAGWSDASNPGSRAPIRRKRLNSAGASDYVEDVDPKFAEPAVPSAPPAEEFDRPAVPSLLVAGRNPNDPSPVSSDGHLNTQVARVDSSYEDLHTGTRSPVESETSNFTSVSQRPMNPNWQPGHGGEFNNFGPNQRQNQQRRQDVLFSNNPDFEIPGVNTPRGGGGRGRGRGGYMGMRQQGPMRPPHPSVLEDMGGDGRYPAPTPPAGPGSNGGVMREI